MNYHSLVYDFANRTRANLDDIEDLAERDESRRVLASHKQVYEVTQLINSLLGLIVLPQQNYFSDIPKTSLDELKKAGWPQPLMQGTLPKDLRNLNDLMRYVRNSIAHFNIEFTNDDHGQISGLKIWNVNKAKKINWTAELTIIDLKLLLEKFTNLILGLETTKAT